MTVTEGEKHELLRICQLAFLPMLQPVLPIFEQFVDHRTFFYPAGKYPPLNLLDYSK